MGGRGDRYISRNIVGHQYRGFFGISLYICCISTTSAVRFLDGVELIACSMAALSLTLYCKQTDQKLTPLSQLSAVINFAQMRGNCNCVDFNMRDV